MKTKLKNLNKGFTIIEVMIVLAIAGLIMVVVFLAVPALERNQRDNARQSIADRVKAEIETYAGNNQGSYPFQPSGSFTISDFVKRYIDTAGGGSMTCNDATQKVNTCDPSLGTPVMTGQDGNHGQPTAFGTGSCIASQAGITHGQFRVCYGAKCSGENLLASGSAVPSSRNYAVVIGLDRDSTDYCVDNG